MTVEEYIITDRISLTLLPHSYTFKIDDVIYESDRLYSTREEMIEGALDDISMQAIEDIAEDEHNDISIALQDLEERLLP